MPRPRSDIQPRIVEAARARFLADGVDGASMREIARDAGTSIGMIVYYFSSKDDLFLAVIEEVYAGIVRDLATILGQDTTARERLRNALVRLGGASDLEFDVLQLMAREALSSSSRLRRIVARLMRGHVPLFIATVSDGVRNGEFDADIPVPFILLAALGLGALPQVARRASRSWPIFASLPDPGRLADLSMRLLFRAVGATSAPERSKEEPTGRVRKRSSR